MLLIIVQHLVIAFLSNHSNNPPAHPKLKIITAHMLNLKGFLNSPHMLNLKGFLNSPHMLNLKGFLKSPHMLNLKGFLNSPHMLNNTGFPCLTQ